MKNSKTILPDVLLDMHMKHPGLDECYFDGFTCGQVELNTNENPFQADSVESRYWLDGWMDAHLGQEPLFNPDGLAEDLTLQLATTMAAENDTHYYAPAELQRNNLIRFIEITGAIAVSAFIGYQLIELVA